MTPIDETPEWSDLVRSATPPIPEDCITRLSLSWDELEGRYNNLRQLCHGTTPWSDVNVLYHEETGNVDFVLPDGRIWGGAWGVTLPPRKMTQEEFDKSLKEYREEMDRLMSRKDPSCGMAGRNPIWTTIAGFLTGAVLMWFVLWGLFE